jgi:hypothetical protein
VGRSSRWRTGCRGAPVAEPQFFWLWAPVNFPTLSTHFDTNDFGDGRRWHEVGSVAPTDGTAPRMMRTVDYRVRWRPGTRWADHFEYHLIDWNGEVHTSSSSRGASSR